MPFARRRLLAVPVLAAVLLGTACSNDDEQPTSIVGATTDATAAATTAPSVTSAPTQAPTSGKKFAAAQLAARLDRAARAKGSVAFSIVSQGAQQLSGNGKASGSGKQADLQLTATIAGSQPLEIIKKDGTVYLKPPTPVGGKEWVKITKSPDDVFRPLYSQVFAGLATAGDLSATASAITGMGTFRVAGSELVDGVPTTKYVASPPAKQGVKLLPQVFQTLTPETLDNATTTVALWIDAQGLLHRTTDVFSIDKKQVATSLIGYSAWGVPVTVTAPPTAAVTSAVRPAG